MSCSETDGKAYRVTLRSIIREPGSPPGLVTLATHDFDREIGTEDGAPLIGRLCVHELEWIQARPGTIWPWDWSFVVEVLTPD